MNFFSRKIKTLSLDQINNFNETYSRYLKNNIPLQPLNLTLSKFKDVERLDFSNNRLIDDDLLYIKMNLNERGSVRFAHLENVKELDLSHNDIESIKPIRKFIKKLPNLKILYLNDNKRIGLPNDIDNFRLIDNGKYQKIQASTGGRKSKMKRSKKNGVRKTKKKIK